MADETPASPKELALKLATQTPALALIAYIVTVVWDLATPLATALPQCIANLQ